MRVLEAIQRVNREVVATTAVITHDAAIAAMADRVVRLGALENARARRIEPVDDAAAAPGCRVTVGAPGDGVVLALLEESESVVRAGTPPVEIGDPRALEVVVDVLSRDVVRLEPGARGALTKRGGEGELAGRVRRIEPTAFTEVSALALAEQRVNVLVDVTGPPARRRRLGHGVRRDASVVVREAADVVRVPVTALVRGDDGRWRVFRVVAGRARARPVTLGRRKDELAEVRGGLAAGDAVVRFWSARVEDGARVAARAF